MGRAQVPHDILWECRLLPLEKKLGRYLTAPEVEFVRQVGSSHKLTAAERRAVKRIWPGMQLDFKLERHRGSS